MTLQPIRLVLLLLTLVIELCRGASISGCKADERNALLNLKKNLEDKHSRLASWKDEDCCNWEGVSCNNVTGHVVRLDLRNPYPCSYADNNDYIQCNEWSLRGLLSQSLLGLKQLNYLDLSWNHFDGPIPMFLGSLHNLRYLNLSLAGFHGFIPDHLGNLSRLKYLDLNHIGWKDYDIPFVYDNSLNFIEDSRWISRLTSLKHLTMDNTKFGNFQNWIEALNELPNIVEIRMRYCDINLFPLSLPYVNFTNLSYLDLSNNFMDLDKIPLWLFNIKSLTHIDLSRNHFRSIPDALKNLTSLEYIDFSLNEFSGALPQVLKSLRKVHTLDLSDNHLNGYLPNWLGELHMLESLHLSGNKFNGSLPNWLGELHMLKSLNLSENKFNGSLPNWFGELHMLESLDLSYNELFGCIPESLGRLVALQELVLSFNNLNGTIPKSIGQLSNLVNLFLDSNFFGGVISEVHFASLAKLKVLNLESNNIILNVSRDWIPPFKLNIIRMSSCKIGPEFPRWLQTQVNLSYLDLSSSHIVDFLPDWFWNVFATHDPYIWLNLSNNGITGSLHHLPPNLCFHIFDLRSNFFSGPLPPTFNISGYMMDISNNSFSGPINPIIWPSYSVMDLACNKLSGQIPIELVNLTGLIYLNLSGNHLVGSIPNDIGLMFSLGFLDMSRNELSGNIPVSLFTTTTLNFLNLSYNNLSGRIPSQIQLRTFSSESYIGNSQLCGFPLTQSCDSNKIINVEVLVDEVTESYYWYVSIAPGFVLGFLIVWGTFFLKKKWKDAYFRYVDYVYDAIYGGEHK